MSGEWAGAARGVDAGFRNAALLQDMDLKAHREALEEKRQGQSDQLFNLQLKQAERTAADWDYNNNPAIDPKQVINSISGVSESAKAKIWNDMSARYGWAEGVKISRKQRDEIIKASGADDTLKSIVGQGRIDFMDEQIAKEADPNKKAALTEQRNRLSAKYFPPNKVDTPTTWQGKAIQEGKSSEDIVKMEKDIRTKENGASEEKERKKEKEKAVKEDDQYRKMLLSNKKSALNAIVLHPSNYDEDVVKRAQKALQNISGIMTAENPDEFSDALDSFVSSGAGANTTFTNRKNIGQTKPKQPAAAKQPSAPPAGFTDSGKTSGGRKVFIKGNQAWLAPKEL